MTANPTSTDLLALIESGQWVIVPKEPTEAMLAVAGPAIDAYYNGTKDAPFEGGVAEVYRAMLAAAPATQGDAEGIGQQEIGADR